MYYAAVFDTRTRDHDPVSRNTLALPPHPPPLSLARAHVRGPRGGRAREGCSRSAAAKVAHVAGGGVEARWRRRTTTTTGETRSARGRARSTRRRHLRRGASRVAATTRTRRSAASHESAGLGERVHFLRRPQRARERVSLGGIVGVLRRATARGAAPAAPTTPPPSARVHGVDVLALEEAPRSSGGGDGDDGGGGWGRRGGGRRGGAGDRRGDGGWRR